MVCSIPVYSIPRALKRYITCRLPRIIQLQLPKEGVMNPIDFVAASTPRLAIRPVADSELATTLDATACDLDS